MIPNTEFSANRTDVSVKLPEKTARNEHRVLSKIDKKTTLPSVFNSCIFVYLSSSSSTLHYILFFTCAVIHPRSQNIYLLNYYIIALRLFFTTKSLCPLLFDRFTWLQTIILIRHIQEIVSVFFGGNYRFKSVFWMLSLGVFGARSDSVTLISMLCAIGHSQHLLANELCALASITPSLRPSFPLAIALQLPFANKIVLFSSFFGIRIENTDRPFHRALRSMCVVWLSTVRSGPAIAWNDHDRIYTVPLFVSGGKLGAFSLRDCAPKD